ncbi:hypothetical protein [Streptomyces sp. AC512_CC834]|uniref:hypothetical protein n=1 Tax=Streptomyces sp. AC512_CC834 TaxID=2823691 RepID=UPI0020B8FFC7|nr:hypothetical protein [Streptomyces sp. AC512_CC834]
MQADAEAPAALDGALQEHAWSPRGSAGLLAGALFQDSPPSVRVPTAALRDPKRIEDAAGATLDQLLWWGSVFRDARRDRPRVANQ